jgi:hypothetical protein
MGNPGDRAVEKMLKGIEGLAREEQAASQTLRQQHAQMLLSEAAMLINVARPCDPEPTLLEASPRGYRGGRTTCALCGQSLKIAKTRFLPSLQTALALIGVTDGVLGWVFGTTLLIAIGLGFGFSAVAVFFDARFRHIIRRP